MTARLLKIALFVILIAAVVGAGYLVRSASSDQEQKQIASINGEPLYESDLPPDVIGEIRSLRNQEYQLKFQAIREAALNRLLKAEAQRRNVEVEELLRTEVDAKIQDPTDEELKASYEAQKDRLGKPAEDMMNALRQTLRKPRVDAARQQYFLKLLDSADVRVLLDAPRVEVAADPGRARGNPDAPVTIVEFSDFQCPYCRRAQPTVRAVLEKYGDKVQHSFRDFPLRDIHARAQAAAEAARCAGEQGQFWEYHKLLYENFGQLARENLVGHAQILKLDQPKFEACLDSNKFAGAIEKDFQEGLRAGVSSTPNFFINGILLSGAQPQAAFERIIDAELAKRK